MLYKETVFADNLYYTMHSHKKVCFAGVYYWDGSESGMVINVPDEYDGHKVTSLGGFAGTGAPGAFGICIPDVDSLCRAETLPEDAAIRQLHFTLNIGKNLNDIALTDLDYFQRNTQTNEYYQILFTVNCAEENKTFYSKDGKLYWRADDALVDDFYYASDYVAE